jgi:hypothetical protein
LKILKGSIKIEDFEADKYKPYPAVSDHSGVSCEIELSY